MTHQHGNGKGFQKCFNCGINLEEGSEFQRMHVFVCDGNSKENLPKQHKDVEVRSKKMRVLCLLYHKRNIISRANKVKTIAQEILNEVLCVSVDQILKKI